MVLPCWPRSAGEASKSFPSPYDGVVALVNVLQLEGMGKLGEEQLQWLDGDLDMGDDTLYAQPSLPTKTPAGAGQSAATASPL